MGADVKQEAKHRIEALYILRTLRKLRFMEGDAEATADIKMLEITLAATHFYVKNTIERGMPTREGVRSEG